MENVADPLHVIIVPMSRNDEANTRTDVQFQGFKIVKRRRAFGGGIKAGINHSPLPFSQMKDNAFTIARPKNGNFQLLTPRRD